MLPLSRVSEPVMQREQNELVLVMALRDTTGILSEEDYPE